MGVSRGIERGWEITTADTRAVARARLAEITRQLAHLMAEVGGIARIIDEIDDASDTADAADASHAKDMTDPDAPRIPPGPSPTVGRGVYRGVAGVYGPATGPEPPMSRAEILAMIDYRATPNHSDSYRNPDCWSPGQVKRLFDSIALRYPEDNG